MRRLRRTASAAAAALLALAMTGGMVGPADATAYVTIQGTGSTWSQNIVSVWISHVNAAGMQVVYTGGGSSKGRKDFANDTVDFAISEIPYQGTDPNTGQADRSNRPYAYLPIVAGGTAFTYQLKIGNTQVNNLRLSGETIAKIFTNKITNWDDPEITKDNNGRKFPSLPITPVVRSDGSGTTAQFTAWLDNQYPSIWRPYNGHAGLTSIYPRQGRQLAAGGSDQVMNTIKSFAGNGTIGYVEYSYPVNANYPVVKVLNKAGYFVEPNQYNTAVALTKAKIRDTLPISNPLYLTQDLTGVYSNPDPRAYPISSYSYMILPIGTDAQDPHMNTAKRQTLADFLDYSLCEGQGSAGQYGYSPLPLNLVQAGFKQIARLKQADPAVTLNANDPTRCNNPTFDGHNLAHNKLADIAPQPASCDKVGQGPCGDATGTNPTTPSAAAGGSGSTAGSGTGTTGSTGGSGPAAAGGGTVDPETGQVVSAGGTGTTATGSTGAVYANPTLVSARAGDGRPFGVLAVIELLALVLVPGFFVSYLRRRPGGQQ
ncbi:phosphate ABC transporter substrate-binding protein PstS [Nocardioides maradonensis]